MFTHAHSSSRCINLQILSDFLRCGDFDFRRSTRLCKLKANLGVVFGFKVLVVATKSQNFLQGKKAAKVITKIA